MLKALENELIAIRKIASTQNITLPPKLTQKCEKEQGECNLTSKPGVSSRENFMDTNTKDKCDSNSGQKQQSTRIYDYKYGYEDIITGSFDEKLDQCITKGITINTCDDEVESLNEAFFIEYEDMLERNTYKNMLKFRKKLPAYIKAKELIKSINDNQVIVISGETGCGKSTQVSYSIKS